MAAGLGSRTSMVTYWPSSGSSSMLIATSTGTPAAGAAAGAAGSAGSATAVGAAGGVAPAASVVSSAYRNPRLTYSPVLGRENTRIDTSTGGSASAASGAAAGASTGSCTGSGAGAGTGAGAGAGAGAAGAGSGGSAGGGAGEGGVTGGAVAASVGISAAGGSSSTIVGESGEGGGRDGARLTRTTRSEALTAHCRSNMRSEARLAAAAARSIGVPGRAPASSTRSCQPRRSHSGGGKSKVRMPSRIIVTGVITTPSRSSALVGRSPGGVWPRSTRWSRM